MEAGRDDVHKAEQLSRYSVVIPQDKPTISWSPGDVYAVTVGFYPDAWIKLGASFSDETWLDFIKEALKAFDPDIDPQSGWDGFCAKLLPIWDSKRHAAGLGDWPGSDRLSDWTKHLATRIAMTATGRSIRTLERRLRYWTNKTRRNLDHYATIENLHRRVVENPDAPLSALAADAAFSDQSHMGRSVRRVTGFSPAKLNRLIQTEESFWCYRLLGERF